MQSGAVNGPRTNASPPPSANWSGRGRRSATRAPRGRSSASASRQPPSTVTCARTRHVSWQTMPCARTPSRRPSSTRPMRLLPAALLMASLALFASPATAIDIDSITKAADAYHSSDPRLDAMYRAALLNTTRQITFASDGTAYVKTGDIPAEWLRDASAEVRPYLFFAKSDPAVAALVRGIIAREGKYLQVDPYANAF